VEVISFWTYSLDELEDIFEAFERSERRKFKAKISMNYALARHIQDHVAALLIENHKTKSLYDLYPDFFSAEDKEEAAGLVSERMKQLELEKHKEAMRAFAARFNANMKNAKGG
jgi:hypothetical protein